MADLKIALMQASGGPHTIDQNLSALDTAMNDAAAQGAHLLMTPELFLSGYGDQDTTLACAQKSDGPILRRIGKMAAHHRIALVLGYPEISDSMVYNTAVVFDEFGNAIHTYRKINLPNDYERACFNRGTIVEVFEFRGVRCAVLICYDIEFPEMARTAALGNAELLIVPTALSTKWRIVPDCVVPVRAFENGVFVAYCNFAGSTAPADFVGLSAIFQPDGQPITRAGHGPEIIVASIDTGKILDIRSQLHYLEDLKFIDRGKDNSEYGPIHCTGGDARPSE